jgi:hypothetical protein
MQHLLQKWHDQGVSRFGQAGWLGQKMADNIDQSY